MWKLIIIIALNGNISTITETVHRPNVCRTIAERTIHDANITAQMAGLPAPSVNWSCLHADNGTLADGSAVQTN